MMRRQRGFTITEVVSATLVITMVIGGTVALLISSTQGMANSVGGDKVLLSNTQGMRYMAEALRSAMKVSINDSDNVITYELPKVSDTVDPATGERELLDPLVSDGVQRSFKANFGNGRVIDQLSGKIICRNIYRTDPEIKSTQYGKGVAPFQMTTIGSARAVTLTIITREQVGTQFKWVRLKTTTLLRNYKG
jgi:type II secretory pathway pseudopilin PulG